MRPLWTTKYIPKFIVSPVWDSWGIMSLPTWTFVSNTTIDETYLMNVIIQVNDPSDHQTIDAIATQLQFHTPSSVSVEKTYE